MFNDHLAATGTTTIAQPLLACQKIEFKFEWVDIVLRVFRKLDRKAERFFNAQAVTRGRQTAKTEWGMQLQDGFL